MPGLGDAPIEPRLRQRMNELAQLLDGLLNGGATGSDRQNGFVLMVFPFDGDGRCNYISNANRAEVLTMLKEQVRRFEGVPDVAGHA